MYPFDYLVKVSHDGIIGVLNVSTVIKNVVFFIEKLFYFNES